MAGASLPKWQVLQPEQATSLYFGFTAPTIALSALAVFLCIVIEATRTLSGDRGRRSEVQTEGERRTRRRHSTASLSRRWPFFTDIIPSNWSLPSRLLYGVLEFENELSYISV